MPGSTDNTEGNASALPSVPSGESQPRTRREARALREAQAKTKSRKRAPGRGAAGSAEPAAGKQPGDAIDPKPAIAAKPATDAKAQGSDREAAAAAPTGSGQCPESHPADTTQARARAKSAFTADTAKPVAASKPEPARPAGAAAAGGQESQAAAAQPKPPASHSKDLAETGLPDAEEADIPAELLVGEPAPKKSRAGRNLPAAIGVGLVLLAIVLVGLFWIQPLLVAAIVVLSGIGCWEVARATTHAKTAVPQLPLYLASVLLPVSAIWGGVEALGFGYIACILVALLFRLMEGLKGAAASVMSSVFIISWVPLLLSFALLMLDTANGQWLIATILLLAVANDTFGYIVGVLIGKHPMAPKISPKKSWEGFGGSMLGSMAIGACAMVFWMDMPWWTGVILAFFTTIAATTGDFAESMVKRELGIKDMSNLLPGHGGIMDRLDSMLFVIPLGYLISHLLAWSVAVF